MTLLYPMHIIPFEVLTIENDGHHILVEVEIKNHKFKMVVDTGASKTVLDRHTLLQAGWQEDQLISTDVLSTGLGTNEMKSHLLELDLFSIQDWTVKNIKVAVLDLSAINYAYQQMNFESVVGVLGGDILVDYAAIINYKMNTLQLNQRKRKAR